MATLHCRTRRIVPCIAVLVFVCVVCACARVSGRMRVAVCVCGCVRVFVCDCVCLRNTFQQYYTCPLISVYVTPANRMGNLFGKKTLVWVPENVKLKEKCADADSWAAKERSLLPSIFLRQPHNHVNVCVYINQRKRKCTNI